ncbi:MAG: c-type cytochrome [Nitriliruptoraceae bacterium]|nr:c-type cytochrome [Nitriliruptoraceae bacterium]
MTRTPRRPKGRVEDGPGRPRAAWRSALATAIAVAGLVVLSAPTAADDQDERDLFVRGGEVYQANCAACHGTQAEGGPGPGRLAGPAIDDTDVNFVDQTLRTGRMPYAEPSVGIRTEQIGDADREALVHYMVEQWDLPGQLLTVGDGDASRGQELYVRNCAACHGAAGDGGISGARVTVPPLVGLDGIAIAQATRVGPFEMPAFDEAVISVDALDDIVAYLDLAAATPRTAAGVREVDQVSASFFAVGLGLLAGVVVLVVARVRRWHPGEPDGLASAPPFEPKR